MFENLDGSGISLFIKKDHRSAGLGFPLTYELIRRGAIRRSNRNNTSNGSGDDGDSKGVWWHFAVKEGNVGSERILGALGAKRMWKSVDFGVDVGKIKAFAAAAAAASARMRKAKDGRGNRREEVDMARL